MFQRQDSLDHTGDARAPFRVADIGLDGADVDALFTENVADCASLNRIAGCCASSVALVAASASRTDSGVQGFRGNRKGTSHLDKRRLAWV